MHIYIRPLLFVFICSLPYGVFSQAKKRLLPHNINLSGYNNFSPAISGDGNKLVYLSDYSDDGELIMMYSSKVDIRNWKDSKEVDRPANIPSVTFRGGYNLNFDGSRLYITMKKTGGIGGYDIWYTEWNGSNWAAPKNLGKPINSSVNDASPSISLDGNTMYFTRCEKMSRGSAENCRIMVSVKQNGRWQEAKELPFPINNGSTMAPKILSDNQSLLFASDKPGGKGGFDLYLSTKSGEGWSEPINLDFINTADNDIFASIAAKGRYILIDRKGERGRVIEEVLIPKELQPKKTLQVVGHAVDGTTGNPVSATAKVYIPDTRERVLFTQTDANGDYNFALIEGNTYDFSLEPSDKAYYTFSKLYPLSEMRFSTRDELKVKLNKIEPGIKNELGSITFKEQDAALSDDAIYEMRRITRFFKEHSNKNFVFSIELHDFLQDSVQSNPDLTEIRTDTVFMETNTQSIDSLENTINTDSTSIVSDSTIAVPMYQILQHFDNNRTQQQGQNLIQYLIGKGIPESQISFTTSIYPKPEGRLPQFWKPIRVYIQLLE